MIHFSTPAALLLFAAVPFLLDRRGSSTRPDAVTETIAFATVGDLADAAAKRTARKLRERSLVLNVLRVIAFSALVLALARPQSSTLFAEVDESGRDIMLSLDVSGSMNALDFFVDGKRTTRLAALKSVVSKFVSERKGDRIGLVIFGSDVFTQCPLTTDHRVLADFVRALEVGMVGDGTALGDGIAVAIRRLRAIPGSSRVIVLVTDGVRTAGSIEPLEAAEIAKREGIKIYTIGIGGNRPAPFEVTDAFGYSRIEYRPVELDEAALRQIAAHTGGLYFNAEATERLNQIYQEISKLEERIDRGLDYFQYEEHFMPFLLLGLVALILHEVAAHTRYLVVP